MPTTRAGSTRLVIDIVLALIFALVLAAAPAVSTAGPAEVASRIAELYPAPFTERGEMDPAVPPPDQILGFAHGSRPARHAAIWSYLTALDESTPRAELRTYGTTHEGRDLLYLIVSSEENMARLEEIRRDIARLADPRRTSAGEARALGEKLPAICWLAYSIHGDELSGADASLEVAYQVAAGLDSLSTRLRRDLVIIIDPIENPDGRDRFIQQMESWAGMAPNPDVQSLQHTGFWPWGRTNHYLFDLNRDWFALVHPESRGRVAAILDWNPQVLVDAHEMGAFDTFLFSPPREPFNPNMTATLYKWWDRFADDKARAFDRHGWSYYTGEWNEEWFPGYGSSWAAYIGTVAILYEQAGVDGSLVKRPDGSLLSYRESVHHQFVASMANLATAAANRRELLADYGTEKRRATAGKGAFLFVPGGQPDRAARLAETLTLQGIEVEVAKAPFSARDARDPRGRALGGRKLPAGTLIVNLNQPMSPLARAILEFDPRMPTSFLKTELHELEKRTDSRLYEVTSWSLALAYGLECYASPSKVEAARERFAVSPPAPGRVTNPAASYGYLIAPESDVSQLALARLLEGGYKLRAARKPFRIGGHDYGPGTLLLRATANPTDLHQAVERVAAETGATITGVESALADVGPDLGGNEFVLLEAPRIAIGSGYPADYASLGPLWHLLDRRLGMRVSLIDLQGLADQDLGKYNVLVLPNLYTGPSTFGRLLTDEGVAKIRKWIEDGGTLIGFNHGAAFAADSARALSAVRLRRDVLGALAEYDSALAGESKALAVPDIDSLAVWEGGPSDAERALRKKEEGEGAAKPSEEDLERADARARLLHPRGATLRADLDTEHWLTSGLGDWVPVNVFSDEALMAKDPVETAARLAEPQELRLGGLLWPEARRRWARTPYLTREAKGRGQIILFAAIPHVRGYWHGSERLLVNALLLGPGMGTTRPVPW